MRLCSSLAIVSTFLGFVFFVTSGATAATIGCDNRQHSDEPIDPNAISQEISLPYGYLCHSLATRGKEISEQEAAYTTNAGIYSPRVDNICNWRIDFVYYDKEGEAYMRDEGETVSSCKQGASRKIAKSKQVPQYGSTCAELIIDGEVKLSQCHGITE